MPRDIPQLDNIEAQLVARLKAEEEIRRQLVSVMALQREQIASTETFAKRQLILETAVTDLRQRVETLEAIKPPVPPVDPPKPDPPIEVTDPLIPVPPTGALTTRNFPGDDVGARVNAADRSLGDRPGSIIVEPGTIATQIHLHPNHDLYLQAGEFPIVNPSPTSKFPQGERYWFGAILQGHHTRIWGAGEGRTKFIEPARFGYIVIQASEDAVLDKGNVLNSLVTNNIGGGFFSVLGANTQPEGGVHSTIQPGNAHGFDYQHIAMLGTSCLGITAGGTALNGHHAEDGKVSFIKGDLLASQTVNIVNGRRIKFEDIVCLRPGKFLALQNLTSIDLEPNTSLDVIQDIEIRRLLIDATDSPLVDGKPVSTGNGIAIQNTVFTQDYGPVLLEDFRIIGGPLIQDFAGRLSTGVYVGGPTARVTIRRGYVQRVGQSIYRFEDGIGSTGDDLVGVSGGTGGTEAFDVANTTHSRFSKIRISIDPNSITASKRIKESGSSDFNRFEDCDPLPILVGKNSKIG